MKPLILLCTLIFGVTLHAQISEDGLIAYYPFNGDVLDYGPSGFHGLMNGGLFADNEAGNPNSALYLDGINDYINLSALAPDFRDQLDEMSIYFKVRFEETTDQQTIISLGNHGENLFTNVFEIEYENNQIQVETETGNAAINHEFGVDQPTWVADQEWHTILVILHGDSLRYCRDGVELYHDVYIPAETTTLSLFLGCFGGTSNNDCCYFGGYIDELQFYDRILPNPENHITLESCPQTSVLYEGQALLPGSMTQFTFPSENCCDSIVTVEVIPLFSSEELLTLETCGDNPVVYDGVTLMPGSSTPFIYTNSSGCDSIVNVDVVSILIIEEQLILESCPDTPIVYEGIPLAPGSSTPFTFTSALGCDSILTVQVIPLASSEEQLTLETCGDNPVVYDGVTLMPGSSTPFAYTSAAGCDSILTVEVVTLPAIETQLELQSCPDVPVDYEGESLFPGSSTTFTFITSAGCDSVVTVQVSSYPPQLGFLGPDISSCGTSIVLSSPVSNTTWSDGNLGAIRQVNESGNYTASYTDSLGCVQSDTIAVRFLNPQIYVPNAFSPNGDGVNDCFRPYAPHPASYLEYELQIFNRWGAIVFSSSDADACWDGTFQGKSLNPDIFAWKLRLISTDCDEVVFQEGDVLLLR